MDLGDDDLIVEVRERTRRVWIDDGLRRQDDANSRIAVPVQLGMQASLVGDWRMSPRLADLESETVLPIDVSLAEVFRRSNTGRVLVAGGPGSGKSTQLLNLANEILERPTPNEEGRCPMVLLLSTWRDPRQSFVDWLYFEIDRTYTLDRQRAERLLRRGRVQLILDGLDELPTSQSDPPGEAVATRLRSLNAFLSNGEYVTTPVVISCRSAQYGEFGVRLQLVEGVRIRPVAPDVAAGFILTSDPQLVDLASAVVQDGALQELLSTPLMVVVSILAFSGLDIPELSDDRELLRRQIFAQYEARMLVRDRVLTTTSEDADPSRTEFNPEQTHQWLVYLARLMERRQVQVLYTDELTPEWLPELGDESALRPGRPTGAFGRLTSRVGLDHASTGTVGGFYGVLFGMLFIAPLVLYSFPNVAGVAAAIGASVLLGVAVFSMFGLARMRPFGLSVAFVLDDDLSISRAATQWRWVARRAVRWLPVVGAIAALGALVVLLGKNNWAPALTAAGTLVAGSLIGCGMVPDYERRPDYPGEALAISGRVVRVLLGLTIGLGVVISAAVAVASGYWGASLSATTLSASLSMVTGPGRAWLRNRALAYGSVRSELLPRRLRDFLDHANEHILLRRSGGGYAYLHRTLQTYFAQADADVVPGFDDRSS